MSCKNDLKEAVELLTKVSIHSSRDRNVDVVHMRLTIRAQIERFLKNLKENEEKEPARCSPNTIWSCPNALDFFFDDKDEMVRSFFCESFEELIHAITWAKNHNRQFVAYTVRGGWLVTLPIDNLDDDGDISISAIIRGVTWR